MKEKTPRAEEVRERLGRRPVVLIGLMGAGKTKTGMMLAQALDLPFADSDTEIERAAGMKVAEIFERFGEEHFRAGERRVIARLIGEGAGIVSTGGGAVMTPATADLIWTQAVSVWVRAEMPVMLERVMRSDRRPLLKNGDPEEILSALAAKRYPVYGKADIVVESHNGPAEAVLNQTIDKLHDFLAGRHGSGRHD